MLKSGLIIKINSDLFTVKIDNNYYDCKLRGKIKNSRIRPLVGDYVKIDKENKTIEEILERTNYLDRPPVANTSISLIVTSLKSPDLNLTLLDKLISIITINHIEPVIVLTKLDLVTDTKSLNELKKIFKYYEDIGIKVFTNKEIKKLKNYLSKKVVTVCGQTGAGKSTLINLFDKNLNLATDEISKSLGRGKHTTRIVELFEVDDFYIVDTPGFSSIDIINYSKEEIKNSFKEFQVIKCKFNDCMHDKEINCGVIEEVNKKNILLSRYENYLKFIKGVK